MIISFRFKNFRSFLDETFVDMKAVSYKEHPSHLIKADNKKLIKTLAVYGANASGKTNLFLAFASFHSFIWGEIFSLRNIPRNHFMSLLHFSSMSKITPFEEDEDNHLPTEMELSFISGEKVYEYGFSICDQKIVTEQLTVDHHVVFTRNDGELSIGRLYEKSLRQRAAIHPNENRLFCSILLCLDIPEISAIMKPFESYFSEQVLYYYDFLEPLQLAGTLFKEDRIYKVLESPEALDYGLTQLRKLGIPAEGFIIDKGIPKLGFRIKSKTSDEYHLRYMDYSKISMGTVKYLRLFMQIYYLSKKGGVLIIDNISNMFHPTIIKFIIDSFQQEKNENMQLIFTTYDVSILNNQQFRRDEVAFVDINEYQESRLYTLADIKVRSDASFSKDYLLGKYGAIPFVNDYIF